MENFRARAKHPHLSASFVYTRLMAHAAQCRCSVRQCVYKCQEYIMCETMDEAEVENGFFFFCFFNVLTHSGVRIFPFIFTEQKCEKYEIVYTVV